jgi:cell fate regulator YaaT (PSP1 superfamily)
VKLDLSLDGGKATITFFAENRVDFRELVRDLANHLRLRVEMRQIGARDETKVTGGLGPCGRELCCSSWLREFHAVSVKMAKEQELSLNPSKLAGMCGRLKCCLRYEYETYLEIKRELPRPGTKVLCVKGDGVVVRQLPMKEAVIVRRDEDAVEVEATLEDLVQQRGAE